MWGGDVRIKSMWLILHIGIYLVINLLEFLFVFTFVEIF